MNSYVYPLDPNGWIDPTGLQCKQGTSITDAASPTGSAQGDNALATGMNGAATVAGRNFTLAGTGIAAAGQTAVAGAVATGSFYRSMVEKDYQFSKSDERFISPSLPKCMREELEKLDWKEFCSSEESWAHIGKACMKK